MSDLTLTLTGDADVVALLQGVAADLQGPAMAAGLIAAALPIVNAAKEKAPKKSTNLARSIHAGEPEVGASGGRIEVGTDMIYARIQEYGGEIEAKEGGWLVFQIGGHWVRVKSVTLKAQPYLRPAFDEKSAAAQHEFAIVVRGFLGRRAA